jgi:hypothetical protein
MEEDAVMIWVGTIVALGTTIDRRAVTETPHVATMNHRHRTVPLGQR